MNGTRSDIYPCRCGLSSAAALLCNIGEVCAATDDKDGACLVGACSHVKGTRSDIYPCKCGLTSAATVQCNIGELCAASDDKDGVCKACVSLSNNIVDSISSAALAFDFETHLKNVFAVKVSDLRPALIIHSMPTHVADFWLTILFNMK